MLDDAAAGCFIVEMEDGLDLDAEAREQRFGTALVGGDDEARSPCRRLEKDRQALQEIADPAFEEQERPGGVDRPARRVSPAA